MEWGLSQGGKIWTCDLPDFISERDNKQKTFSLLKRLFKSGRQDSNLRPPAPKAGAMLLSLLGLAEREGFEPSVQFNPYDDLANRSFRPLRHLTFLFLKGGKNKSYGLTFPNHFLKVFCWLA